MVTLMGCMGMIRTENSARSSASLEPQIARGELVRADDAKQSGKDSCREEMPFIVAELGERNAYLLSLDIISIH